MTNGFYVAWAVWDAEHRALTARVAGLEEETKKERWQQANRDELRKNRVWRAALAVMSGIACPILVTALIAWLHVP